MRCALHSSKILFLGGAFSADAVSGKRPLLLRPIDKLVHFRNRKEFILVLRGHNFQVARTDSGQVQLFKVVK